MAAAGGGGARGGLASRREVSPCRPRLSAATAAEQGPRRPRSAPERDPPGCLLPCLPAPALALVTGALSVQDVCCLMCTCSALRAALSRPRLWGGLASRDFAAAVSNDAGRGRGRGGGAAHAGYRKLWLRRVPRVSSPLVAGAVERSLMSVPRFKGVLAGDAGVGKTTLLASQLRRRYAGARAVNINPIDVPFAVLQYGDVDASNGHPSPNRALHLQVWDSGHNSLRSFTRPRHATTPLANSSVVWLVYDCAQRSTFESVRRNWWPRVRRALLPWSIVCVVANKSDTDERERQVTPDEGRAFAARLARAPRADATAVAPADVVFVEASAASGAGVDDCFDAVAALLAARFVPHEDTHDGGAAYGGPHGPPEGARAAAARRIAPTPTASKRHAASLVALLLGVVALAVCVVTLAWGAAG